jgi:hypothetical protein
MKKSLFLALTFLVSATAVIARDENSNDSQIIEIDDVSTFSMELTITKQELKTLFRLLKESPPAHDMWLLELNKACSYKSAQACTCANSLVWFRKFVGLGLFGEAIYLLTDTLDHNFGGMVTGVRCFGIAALAFIGAALSLIDNNEQGSEEFDVDTLIKRINMVKIDGRNLMAIEKSNENTYKLSIFSTYLNNTLKELQEKCIISFASR